MKSRNNLGNIFLAVGTTIFILGFGGCTVNFVGQLGNASVGNNFILVSFAGLVVAGVGIILRRMSNRKREDTK